MHLIFHLTGEHETLPRAEVAALLEGTGLRYGIVHSFDQVLVVETAASADAFKRLGMTHGVYEYLGSCDPNYRDIVSLTRGIAPVVEDGFAVRIKRVKEHSKDLRRDTLERAMGRVVDRRVDLSNPRCLLVGFLTDKFVLGKLLLSLHDFRFPRRHPKERPYFHPGVMLPRTARAVVNLTRLSPGDRFVDPFCGTGGLLIEAGLIGGDVYGCDIDVEKVRGCEENLQHYGIRGNVMAGDAREMGGEYTCFFDALATDPPYGISASTMGLSLGELYRGSIESFYRMLKDDRYACLIVPSGVRIEEHVEKTGFRIIEKHFERVHRSLTRKIMVMHKWR